MLSFLTPFFEMIAHNACRNRSYRGVVERVHVPDSLVSWSSSWPDYKPIEYTDPRILSDKPVWADEPSTHGILFNQAEKGLNRCSHLGTYTVDGGRPLNPMGRTGLCGRGVLGRWGPNHAADAILTRVSSEGRNEFLAIRRKDCNQWAIPGGMVDLGEEPVQTAVRELLEEAFADRNSSEIMRAIDVDPAVLYKGYVDDPRNTDNAWMETMVFNFKANSALRDYMIRAGDDANSAKWLDLENPGVELYASHGRFIEILKQSLAKGKGEL